MFLALQIGVEHSVLDGGRQQGFGHRLRVGELPVAIDTLDCLGVSRVVEALARPSGTHLDHLGEVFQVQQLRQVRAIEAVEQRREARGLGVVVTGPDHGAGNDAGHQKDAGLGGVVTQGRWGSASGSPALDEPQLGVARRCVDRILSTAAWPVSIWVQYAQHDIAPSSAMPVMCNPQCSA
jgi:hypothetical protein